MKWFELSPENSRKWRAFRRRKRAFYSLLVIIFLMIGTAFADLYSNTRPFVVSYHGEIYFPFLKTYPETTFGGAFDTEADYTDDFVKGQFSQDGNWAIYPPIPWDYAAINRDPALQHPSPPSKENLLGTDNRGRDVLARLIYGFRLSIIFALVLVAVEIGIGVIVGSIEGFFGGWVDIIIQRAIEIWEAMPYLYLLIILAAILEPSIPLLIFIMSLFGWIGIQGLVRIDFLKARNREYVKAARALGVGNVAIMFRHILPNALTAVITRVPFSIAGAMTGLVSLDFLGLGVRSPTPSLGELLSQAQSNISAWWIGIPTVATLMILLILVTFVGEAVLDVFDPKRR